MARWVARFWLDLGRPPARPSRPSAKSTQPCLYPPARLSVFVCHALAAAWAVYSGPHAVCARRLPPVLAAPDARGV